MTDVAQRVAGPRRGDAGGQCVVGRRDQRGVFGSWCADDEAACGVAAPAAQRRAEVDGDEVAVGEYLTIGDAVHDGVVDADAEHRGEGARRPRGVVVEERRPGTVTGEDMGGDLVELGGGLAGPVLLGGGS